MSACPSYGVGTEFTCLSVSVSLSEVADTVRTLGDSMFEASDSLGSVRAYRGYVGTEGYSLFDVPRFGSITMLVLGWLI